MDKFFPFKKRFIHSYPVSRVHKSATLDWKAKVVCANCNNTWMSKIESKYAEPAMTPLILGHTGIPIAQSQADAIGRFAFKTAVVLDHLSRVRQPFFPRSIRHGFKNHPHAIPASVRMWLAGFARFEGGNSKTVYHEGELPTGQVVEFYVCTYSVGHLSFQVVSMKSPFAPHMVFRPRDERFEFLAVPFWPWIPSGVVWPPARVLETAADFDAFADRWRNLFIRPVE